MATVHASTWQEYRHCIRNLFPSLTTDTSLDHWIDTHLSYDVRAACLLVGESSGTGTCMRSQARWPRRLVKTYLLPRFQGGSISQVMRHTDPMTCFMYAQGKWACLLLATCVHLSSEDKRNSETHNSILFVRFAKYLVVACVACRQFYSAWPFLLRLLMSLSFSFLQASSGLARLVRTAGACWSWRGENTYWNQSDSNWLRTSGITYSNDASIYLSSWRLCRETY